MSVLYRKYRPKTFAEIIGQNHIKITLASEIIHDLIAHAYLFVGPRGTGKTTTARLLARSINCLQRKKDDAEPCNDCSTCKQFLEGGSLDIIEIDAATHTQVDNVRDNIIANAQIPPYNPVGYKVFIIDEVHMLSRHAFNALLKTIEEPPKRIIFILATTDVYKVPDTIISRCQRFDFKKLPQKLMIDRLRTIATQESITVSEDILASIGRRAQGYMRDAESMLGQLISIAENKAISEEQAQLVLPRNNWQQIEILMQYLQTRNTAGVLEHILFTVNEGIDMENLLTDTIEYTRQLLLRKTIGTGYSPDFDEKTSRRLIQMADSFTADELKELLEIFIMQDAQAGSSMIASLPLELACLTFCELRTDRKVNTNSGNDKLESKEFHKVSTTKTINKPSSSLQSLNGLWSKIIKELKKYNHSLSMFLKSAHPLNDIKDKITLGFQYDFHASQVKEKINKQKVEEIMSRVLDRKVTIDCIVDTEYLQNHKNFNGAQDKEVQEVLDVMGGGEVLQA